MESNEVDTEDNTSAEQKDEEQSKAADDVTEKEKKGEKLLPMF